jgi:Fur family transcriptional regulator, ferric uptake regulator
MMSDESHSPDAKLSAKAAEFWRARGGHLTFVRRVICDCVELQSSLFSSEALWRECRKVDHGISMASVYRTLVDLLESGLLREIASSNDQRLFVCADVATAEKGFLICKNCNRVVPLENHCLALREGAAIRGLGFRTNGMNLLIEADCENYHTHGDCEHHSAEESPRASAP